MPLEIPQIPNLNVQTPQMPSPMDQYAKMLQLKALSGEQQLMPLRLQEAQQDVQAKSLQNQETQAQIDSRKGLMDAITSGVFNKYAGVETPDGTGFDAAGAMKDLVANHKVLPEQAMQQVNSLLTVAKNQSEIAKANAEAGSAQQNIRVKTLESVADKLGSIQDMPANDAVKALDSFKQTLVKSPGSYKGLTQDEMAHLYGMDLEHLPAVSELMGLEGKIADFHKSKAEAVAAQQKQAGGPLMPVEEAEMQDFIKNPPKGYQPTPDGFAKWKASLNPQAQIVAQGGAPSSALVQAVANGSMKIGDVLTPRTPLPIRKQFLDEVLKTNPQFNSANYDIEKGVMREFTSGDAAKNLTAFNTAIEHAQQLSKATDELDNTDIRALNKIGNVLGYQFGSDKTTNFNVIKNALSGEISKVFKGGQATDAEIREVQQPFNAANSPEQLKGAIKNAIALMNSKRDALQAQFEAGKKGQPNFGGTDAAQPDAFSAFGGKKR